MAVAEFEDFAQAMRAKLLREIGTPTLSLLDKPALADLHP
ncbi:DUF1194 domain-containing protein [Chthonobacter albigriseus]|nr:DUF1194 domain-containing protein [Chthonobacter albigriseus]